MNSPTSAVGGPLLWIMLFAWWVTYEIRNPIRDRKGRPESILRRLMPLWIGLLGLLFWFAAIVGVDSDLLFLSCLAIGTVIQIYAAIYAFARRRTR
ncbi:MAG: hypothetical protein J7498_14865 [Sphingobium sp.]|nr:hypothetical protein [Sphingobium sp.]